MGKRLLTIKLLQILSSGAIYKVSRLAELLETNERNIIEYKRELVQAGYDIASIPGKYGGYQLVSSSILPSIKLSREEKKAVKESFKYILSKKDFVYKDNYEKGMGKIFSSITMEYDDSDLISVDKYQLSMSEKQIQERYLAIEEAINLKQSIEIEYNSLKNGLKKHILHPYKLFLYNNSWFFLAWNPEVGDVWTFKVNRIKNYKLLNEKFRVWKYFNANNYLDKFGFISNGEYYKIILIASNKRAALMKERIYGKNQTLEALDNGKVKISLEMQNKEYIISYILSCADEVEVIEPQWLKDELLTKIDIIKNKYNN